MRREKNITMSIKDKTAGTDLFKLHVRCVTLHYSVANCAEEEGRK